MLWWGRRVKDRAKKDPRMRKIMGERDIAVE